MSGSVTFPARGIAIGGVGCIIFIFKRFTLFPSGPIAVIVEGLSWRKQGRLPVLVIGIIQPICAVATPKRAAPAWRSAGSQAGTVGPVTAVVTTGTRAGLSSQGTAVGVGESVVEVADAVDAPDNWHPERVYANMSTTGKLLAVFLTRASLRRPPQSFNTQIASL